MIFIFRWIFVCFFCLDFEGVWEMCFGCFLYKYINVCIAFRLGVGGSCFFGEVLVQVQREFWEVSYKWGVQRFSFLEVLNFFVFFIIRFFFVEFGLGGQNVGFFFRRFVRYFLDFLWMLFFKFLGFLFYFRVEFLGFYIFYNLCLCLFFCKEKFIFLKFKFLF